MNNFMPSTGAAPRKRNISVLKQSPQTKRRSAIPIPNGRKLIHQTSQNKTSKVNCCKSFRKHRLFMRSEINALTNEDNQMPFEMHEQPADDRSFFNTDGGDCHS